VDKRISGLLTETGGVKNTEMILKMNINKRSGSGFTLVELLVVIAIIALLMGVLLPALNRAREQGKRAVCLYYQRQMAGAWMMYADDNSDKIVNGDAEEYGQYPELPCTAAAGTYVSGGIHYKERPWVMRDWADAPPCWPSGVAFGLAEKKDQIKRGALFKYVKDVKAYKCPRANADETRSFSVVDGMNVTVIVGSGASPSGVGSGATLIKNRQQIKKTYERMIFVDDGGVQAKTEGGWTVYVTRLAWWDVPSARHGDGTTFSFTDGHAEYHKWVENSTFEAIRIGISGTSNPAYPSSKDIRWSSIVAWGSDIAGKGN
jgi:prepilin-type N-terminal cleavage/methylation domain-containing protein/prepilin-type processing-associated H-X9-DG protein